MPASAAPDPHDPLAPRVDDPWFHRWWRRGPRSAYRRPLRITAAMLLLALVAFVVVILLGSG
ncbi:hypothetical protein [Nannocystis punicea]|uniref:Uncharacterized protein n=1 Tax=Nannocystis punicea TaxID=2995304 RepID=A0ABY7GUK9_9BACT|nr:hypothetical protein [Nannocystis poenicansa]WAS90604.1 hypothetical protein O0S08_30830 [Nannocystis poenicansa]